MIRTPTFLFVSLLALPVVAQDKPADGGGAGGKGGIQAADVEAVEGKGAKEEGADGKGGKEGFSLDKAPRVLDARGQCRFDGAVAPKRLMPGQTGNLRVTMIFEGDAVMTSPSALQLKAGPGSMELASWTLQPPTVARVAPAYLGQQVYDNWALIEAQVVMPSNARMGEKRNVVLEVEFDLHHGTSGQSLGHFRETVAIPCEVGLANSPAVAVRTGQAGAGTPVDPSAAPVEAKGPGADAQPQATKPANPSPSAADLTEPAKVGSANPSQNEPEVASEGGLEAEGASPSGWMLGGGAAAAFLGVLLALLLRRRG